MIIFYLRYYWKIVIFLVRGFFFKGALWDECTNTYIFPIIYIYIWYRFMREYKQNLFILFKDWRRWVYPYSTHKHTVNFKFQPSSVKHITDRINNLNKNISIFSICHLNCFKMHPSLLKINKLRTVIPKLDIRSSKVNFIL